MFTPRLRRRRHSLDTYVREEVAQRVSITENAPVPPRPTSSEAASETGEERPVATDSTNERLSA
jgi:hypothetical protein